jgi:hypothetical protein
VGELTEGGYDVRKDVCDLVTHGQKNHNDDDRNENQDQRVLDHSLAALAHGMTATHWRLPSFLAHGERLKR